MAHKKPYEYNHPPSVLALINVLKVGEANDIDDDLE